MYLGFVTTGCGVGAWWAWSSCWDGLSRFAAVTASLGCYLTLLATGEVLFPERKLKYVVYVEIPGDRMELPCYTYEQAFHVALYAQLLAFEMHGIWLPVSISPDQPERREYARSRR